MLDEHFSVKWDAHGGDWRRRAHRKRGGATYRIVRYADDFVIMVHGSKAHAEALREELSQVIAPLGLRLSEAKTRVCHIDEGFDFPGFRVQRRTKRRTARKAVYTYPSRKSLNAILDKARAATRRSRHKTLADLPRQLNPILRGWCNYFRHGVSKATFGYLSHFAWWRVVGWLRKRHPRLNRGTFRRRLLPDWQIKDGNVAMFWPESVPVTRYLYRGTRIPTPGEGILAETAEPAGTRGAPDGGRLARPVRPYPHSYPARAGGRRRREGRRGLAELGTFVLAPWSGWRCRPADLACPVSQVRSRAAIT